MDVKIVFNYFFFVSISSNSQGISTVNRWHNTTLWTRSTPTKDIVLSYFEISAGLHGASRQIYSGDNIEIVLYDYVSRLQPKQDFEMREGGSAMKQAPEKKFRAACLDIAGYTLPLLMLFLFITDSPGFCKRNDTVIRKQTPQSCFTMLCSIAFA